MNLKSLDYFLPRENLALEPAVPRDSSKLFVYDAKADKIQFDHFYNLDKYLPKNSFLVLNNTRVLPARVEMKKESGGKVTVLFLVSESVDKNMVKAMVDRQVDVGGKLFFLSGESVEVIRQKEHFFTLKYAFSKKKLFELLYIYGTMPIPLYLKKTRLKRDELLEKYQTIFAEKEGSSAAPTASLHFTQRVFDQLERKGIEKYFITLHVGLGTFAPITNENLKNKKLHEEYYEVDEGALQSINTLRSKGKKLVGVGTTVVRTLESEAQRRIFSSASRLKGSPKPLTQKQPFSLFKTNLFIIPPYDFKMIDILITNFHLPKSSLMMLVSAFLQFKGAKRSLVELYNIAIKNEFRFYSFGDSMLIL